jgi:hypothetical protein
MSSNLSFSSTAVRDAVGDRGITVIPPAEKTSAITRVRYLEQELLDGDGHVRRRTDRAKAEETVAQINELRHALGWLEIDLEGRWRWPS